MSKQAISPNEDTAGQAAADTPLVSAAEIEQLLRAHGALEVPLRDPRWHDSVQALLREWRGKYWKRRLRLMRTEKSVALVKHAYEGTWAKVELPDLTSQSVIPYQYGERGLFINPYVEKRVHLLLLNRLLQRFAPDSVLEVGSGSGFMTLLSAAGYPHSSFSGVELTAAGVASAQMLGRQVPFPEELVNFAPFDVDPSRPGQVSFSQGNACKLPFSDDAFDLVYTSLALEQMDAVLDQALKEIHRVARHHVVFIEPFRDANQTKLRRYYTGARDYLRLRTQDLSRYGFTVIEVHTDFPAKVTRGVAVAVAEVEASSK